MSKKFSQQFSCSKMMLPEHRGSLQQHADQNRWEQEYRRPILDEQEQEQLQQILEQALSKKQSIKLIVLNESGRQTIYGIPLRINPGTGTILLSTGCVRPLAVKAADVIHLEKTDPG